mmetsp:Transcript_5623/g.12492  ORF Transcript_5623/g.12492 Transcript_5623/m.12492 type:complete len:466 (-) Transcript_5623:139-1536(-)
MPMTQSSFKNSGDAWCNRKPAQKAQKGMLNPDAADFVLPSMVLCPAASCIHQVDAELNLDTKPDDIGEPGDIQDQADQRKLFRSVKLKETVAYVYDRTRPTPDIQEMRNACSQRIQNMIFQLIERLAEFSTFGPVTTLPFGSIEAGIDTISSDINISLHYGYFFGDTETIKSESSRILTCIANELELSSNSKFSIERRTGHLVRVPVLKIYDHTAGYSVDISIENSNAHKKTCFLRACVEIDPRFRCLACLVKYWAHCRQINDAKYKFLNSFAYTLAVNQFLQIQSPPILPRFPDFILATHAKLVEYEIICTDLKNSYKGFGEKNKQTPEELLVKFMFFMSEIFEENNERKCISVRHGMLKPTAAFVFGKDLLCIEDLFDPAINVARSLVAQTFARIKHEFLRACTVLNETEDFTKACQYLRFATPLRGSPAVAHSVKAPALAYLWSLERFSRVRYADKWQVKLQ